RSCPRAADDPRVPAGRMRAGARAVAQRRGDPAPDRHAARPRADRSRASGHAAGGRGAGTPRGHRHRRLGRLARRHLSPRRPAGVPAARRRARARGRGRAAARRPRRAAPQRDGRARRSPRPSLLGRRAGLGPRRALAALYERSLGRRRSETDRTRRLSGSAVAQPNECVPERVDLVADVRLAAPVRPPALAPRSQPALPVDAALAVAAVQDHLDVDLARKLAREVPVQVQLLAGNDEEVLAHDFFYPIGPRLVKWDRNRARARRAVRSSRDGRRGLPPRRTGPRSSSSSSLPSSPAGLSTGARNAAAKSSAETATAPARRAASRTARSDEATTVPAPPFAASARSTSSAVSGGRENTTCTWPRAGAPASRRAPSKTTMKSSPVRRAAAPTATSR